MVGGWVQQHVVNHVHLWWAGGDKGVDGSLKRKLGMDSPLRYITASTSFSSSKESRSPPTRLLPATCCTPGPSHLRLLVALGLPALRVVAMVHVLTLQAAKRLALSEACTGQPAR